MAFHNRGLYEHITKALEVEELRFAEFQLAKASFQEAEAITNDYIKQKETVLTQKVKVAQGELDDLRKITFARNRCK